MFAQVCVHVATLPQSGELNGDWMAVVSSIWDGLEGYGRGGRCGLTGLRSSLSSCESSGSGEEPGSVCVAIVVVETGRDGEEEEAVQEEEGSNTCSCVFSLITSS